jgi:DNA-binding transcriptional ArsR family regulator
VDVFAVLAEPTRRQILDQLAARARSVNELAGVLAITQPTMSKHLKVLREAGFVSRRGSAQQRIYQLEPEPFQTFEAWLSRYRAMWSRHLDALERHLDAKEIADAEKGLPAGRRRPGRRPRRR